MPLTFTFGLSPGRNSASRPICSATAMPASHNVWSSVVVSPSSAPCSVTATTAPVSRSTACSALCAKCVRAPVLHLRHPRILVRRTLPLLVRRALLALAIQPCQLFPRRRVDARGFRQPSQKLFVTLARVAPHDRAHCRVGFQRRGIDGDPLALQQPAISQYAQHPAEYFAMGVHIDRPPGA